MLTFSIIFLLLSSAIDLILMAHSEQRRFFENLVNLFGNVFNNAKKVLEVGSQNINGTVRDFFLLADEYVGVDIGDGNMVDYVIPGELLELPDAWADVVVSTECLEHAENWNRIFSNMIRILKPSGLFVMTCASLGRPAHGTSDSEVGSSPFTHSYYKNLGLDDIRNQIDIAWFFDRHSFEVDSKSGDLYFWGLRSFNSFEVLLGDIPTIEDRLARAQGQLAQVISRELLLKKKFQDLTSRLELTDSLLTQANRERDDLLAQKDQALQELTRLNKQHDILASELDEIIINRDNLLGKINNLNRQIDDLSHKLIAADSSSHFLLSEKEKLVNDNTALVQQLNELSLKLDNSEARVGALKLEFNTIAAENKMLSKQVTEAGALLDHKGKEVVDTHLKLDCQILNNKSLIRERDKMLADLTVLRTSLQDKEAELSDLEDTYNSLRLRFLRRRG